MPSTKLDGKVVTGWRLDGTPLSKVYRDGALVFDRVPPPPPSPVHSSQRSAMSINSSYLKVGNITYYGQGRKNSQSFGSRSFYTSGGIFGSWYVYDTITAYDSSTGARYTLLSFSTMAGANGWSELTTDGVNFTPRSAFYVDPAQGLGNYLRSDNGFVLPLSGVYDLTFYALV